MFWPLQERYLAHASFFDSFFVIHTICVTKVHHQLGKINRCGEKNNFPKELLNCLVRLYTSRSLQKKMLIMCHPWGSIQEFLEQAEGGEPPLGQCPKKLRRGWDDDRNSFCDEHVEDQPVCQILSFSLSLREVVTGSAGDTLIKEPLWNVVGQFRWAAAAKLARGIDSKSVLSFLISKAAWTILNVLPCKETQIVK